MGRGRRLAACVAVSSCCVFSALLFAPAHSVSAATLTVSVVGDPASGSCSGGSGSLRQCIAEAAVLGGRNLITFAPATNGTAIVLGGAIEIPMAVGALTIQGNGPSQTVIDAHGSVTGDRAFVVQHGATVTMRGLTITHGAGAGAGGAINSQGTLTVDTVDFVANAVTGAAGSAQGGAIFGGSYSGADSVTVVDSVFEDNVAAARDASGGAIAMCCGPSTLSIAGSTFSRNHAGANGGDSASGGAVLNRGTMTVSNSTFDGNTATSGNSASGGALSTCCDGTATISGSTFSNNGVSGAFADGGGIWVGASALTVSNSTLSGNSATATRAPLGATEGVSTAAGGNLLLDSVDTPQAPPATLTNVTISGGTAGAGANLAVGSQHTVVMGNTIVSGAPGNNCVVSSSAVFVDVGHNLDDGNPSTCMFSALHDDVVGRDARLGPLQNNGGPTATLSLLAGSAAIDTGSITLCRAAPVSMLDQRGLPRDEARADTTCDVGAFEVQGVTATPTPTPSPAGSVLGIVHVPNTGGAPSAAAYLACPSRRARP